MSEHSKQAVVRRMSSTALTSPKPFLPNTATKGISSGQFTRTRRGYQESGIVKPDLKKDKEQRSAQSEDVSIKYEKLVEFLTKSLGNDGSDIEQQMVDSNKQQALHAVVQTEEISKTDHNRNKFVGKQDVQTSLSVWKNETLDSSKKNIECEILSLDGEIKVAPCRDKKYSIASLVERPSDDDFVCPPLPPPPSDNDLNTYSLNSSAKVEPTQPRSIVGPPTYKAQAKFNVWTPNSVNKTNGNTEVVGVKTASGPVGFRSVARPVSKKPANGRTQSSTTTSYTIPDHGLPKQSENVRVTPEHELPDGAVYETQTLEDGMLHTDTYYPTPGEKSVLERTKKTTIIRAEHHDGMGPTDDKGVPVALRSTVENQKAWYKNMFKQIHKFDSESDEKNGHSSESADVQEDRPIVSQSSSYKPKRPLGRITDYTPSEHVVENKPTGNKVPTASTSYKPSSKQSVERIEKNSSSEPVHGTDYSLKDSFTMADHVVMEPKHVVTINHNKQKNEAKAQTKRQPAKVKFNFVAQSDKQLTLMKDHVVIITRDINKDWYGGETPDGKHTGIFPASYVEVLSQATTKKIIRGLAKAKFDFTASNPKQLSVKKGDSIELIEKIDKNWYKGCIGQRTGILPSNYIEVVKEPEEKLNTAGSIQNTVNNKAATNPATEYTHKATPSSSSSSSEPDDKEKMAKASFLAHAVVNSGSNLSKPQLRKGEFDIPELDDKVIGIPAKMNTDHTPQGSYDTTLSTTSSSLHSDLGQNLNINKPMATLLSSESSHSSSSSVPMQPNLEPEDDFPAREKHIALYPYVPQNEDELELIGGDSVLVIEKCDDGWFVGTCERTGAFGTFPGNYVTPVE